MPPEFTISPHEQRLLGDIARLAIVAGFAGKDIHTALPPAPQGVLCAMLGSFVTLKMGARLRGCMGSMVGQEPLYINVARMAQAAAFDDPRFAPLTPQEWEQCQLEISVLGPLSPCPDPERIEIGRHGLLLSHAGRSGVFLPKVPVEQGWDRPAYLAHLCQKAGLPQGTWQRPEAQLFWYEAFAFMVNDSH